MPVQEFLPRPSDRWIPWYFAAFFVALVMVLAPMCYIAVHTYTGVVTDHAYEKGLSYNQDIVAAESAKSLRWHGNIELAFDNASHIVKAFYNLADENDQPVDGAKITLWLVRPTQSGLDQKADMQQVAKSRYEATVVLPVAGLWEARVAVLRGGQNFQTIKRVVLR